MSFEEVARSGDGTRRDDERKRSRMEWKLTYRRSLTLSVGVDDLSLHPPFLLSACKRLCLSSEDVFCFEKSASVQREWT